MQGNEERWRSEGDGTEASSRQLVSVSNLTQVNLAVPVCYLVILTWTNLVISSLYSHH